MLLLLLSYFFCFKSFTSQDFQIITGAAQGTSYTVKYVSTTEIVTKKDLDSIFRVIDQSLSLYHPASLINAFNKDGKVKMDLHMKNVVEASMVCYKESGKVFDISSAALSELWGFGVSPHQKPPSAAEIKKRLAITGSHLLEVKGDSLLAKKKGIKIDCNGIAQGYTVDVIADYLTTRGVTQYMVEVGGEIRVSGPHPESAYWKIGVESPDVLAKNWHPIQQVVGIQDLSITTSGNYRKFYNANGKSFSHVINPLVGKPVDNGVIAVTVIAKTAMMADAWDNALFVMGVDKAMNYIATRNDLQAYMIYMDQQGNIKDTATPGFKALKTIH